MTNQAIWLLTATDRWVLLLLAAVLLEALCVWAYRGDRDPAPWAPTHTTNLPEAEHIPTPVAETASVLGVPGQ